MEAERAIRLVVEWIHANHLDYPTEGLEADPFDGGWAVYEPVDVVETDPMAFLDTLVVDQSVFLVADSGRIKEVSTAVPPQRAVDEFLAEERGTAARADFEGADVERAELERVGARLLAEGEISSFTFVEEAGAGTDEAIAAEASRLLEPIAQRLALLGPPGWERFTAEFAFTVSAEIAQLRFAPGRGRLVPVPASIAELVRDQREVAARMPAGPWWRLVLTVTNRGEMTVDYDYGDRPFPDDQLLAAEHYRNDLATYPRPAVPDWLADYLAEAAPEPPARSAPRMLLDTRLNFRNLHADPRVISYGRRSIELERVEWVRYWVVHTTSSGTFGRSRLEDTNWHFGVGTHPVKSSPLGDLMFHTDGPNPAPPPAWSFLVELAREYLEPRLVARLVDRIHRGDTVDVGGLSVHRGGVGSGEDLLPWRSIAGAARLADGAVRIYRRDEARPMFSVPLESPNAVLVPALLTALTE